MLCQIIGKEIIYFLFFPHALYYRKKLFGGRASGAGREFGGARAGSGITTAATNTQGQVELREQEENSIPRLLLGHPSAPLLLPAAMALP